MRNNLFQAIVIMATLPVTIADGFSQEKSIADLDFLIGTWEVREDNNEKTWWEKTTRTGQFIMDSTYIELQSVAISSSGKERTYRWFIHCNSKTQQFEMISIFSNWHNVQFDILEWDKAKRKLIVRSGEKDPGTNDYHERFGEITFDENFSRYIWTGENKYGDPDNPNIWNYQEKGTRVNY